MTQTTKVFSFAIAMFAIIGLVTFPLASAELYPRGYDGCTPGFYKANAKKNDGDQWPAGFTPETTLGSLGIVFAGSGEDHSETSLLDALKFHGGKGVDGAERIFLRAAVAAMLNANQDALVLNYPVPAEAFLPVEMGPNGIINNNLASDNRDAVLHNAGLLDEMNNIGCSLNNSGKIIEDDIARFK